jgi:TRAP-type C4-dicarboxylate transport system substrate-binding protein
VKITFNFKPILQLSTLCAAAIMFASPAIAEAELVLSSWLPPTHPLVKNAIKPWAAQVSEATDGRVTVRVLGRPLGPPPTHFDLAKDGVADITYGLHSFNRDNRFLRSRVGQFSFLGDDASTASQAFWTVYSEQLDAQSEHQGVKLLSLFLHGPGMFNTGDRKIEIAENFNGLKIRTPGGYIAELSQALGSVTLFMSPGEVFEKLSRGVIDGVTFPYEGLKAFRLTGHIDYTMKVPGGLYNTSWFLVLNEGMWSKISTKDQAAIEAISGVAFAKLAGEAWNAADEAGLAAMKKAGIDIYEAPASVLSAIKRKAEPLEAAWYSAVKESGFDGKAALNTLRTKASE